MTQRDLGDYLADRAPDVAEKVFKHSNLLKWRWGANERMPDQSRIAVVLSRLFDKLSADPELESVGTGGLHVQRNRDLGTVDVLVYVERIVLPEECDPDHVGDATNMEAASHDAGDEGDDEGDAEGTG